MSTAIQWTDETWNPTTGCDRVSAGCDRCYALTLAARLKRMGQPRYQSDGDPRTSGPGFGLALHMDVLGKPLSWRKPRRVFVNSMSDLFHPDIPEDYIVRVFGVMAACSQHTFQILTKRPGRMAAFTRRLSWDGDAPYRGADPARCPHFQGRALDGCEAPLPNVWLGVSIESDRYAFRAGVLRDTNAAVRFLSLEPLIGPLPSLGLSGIDWVIVGGESGHGARPLNLDWVRSIRDRAEDVGAAFFMKQLGSAHGRDHHNIETFPDDLRIRHYPKEPIHG